MEPGLSEAPIADDRGCRCLERFGRFLHVQAAEESKLNDSSLTCIYLFKFEECCLQTHYSRILGLNTGGLTPTDPDRFTTSFDTTLSAGVIDQRSSHQIR